MVTPIFSSTVHLPYKTRFTSVVRQEENKQAYWATWDYANRRHLKGVFLTLTAPSRAGDLVTVNNQMREAWDKLRDLLDSKLARGLTYIKVNEFQKNKSMRDKYFWKTKFLKLSVHKIF